MSSVVSAQDVGDTLYIEDFYQLVINHHPIAQQAVLLRQQGDQALTAARGGFDPKLVSSFNTKSFNGTDYYDIWDTYVQVPTLLNIDLKAGFERNSGTFLNPENSLPQGGLYYAGISIPLGQGLINNQRKIALKKGEISRQELAIQAEMVLNNLLLDANKVYWWWYESYQKHRVTSQNLSLIEERFKGVRSNVLNGEEAAIDSVEALIQVQQWTNTLRSTEIDLLNSYLLLQNFIWTDSILSGRLVPQQDFTPSITDLDLYLRAAAAHPEWQLLSLKNSSMELDRKLSQERLKPVINLDYQVLLGQDNQSEIGNYLASNYKGSILFEFPVLLRKERANLKTVKLKLERNQLEQDLKLRKISNQILEAHNTMDGLRLMIKQQVNMIANYQKLLRGERLKFENGESSIFLINSRENSNLQAEMKMIELISKYGKSEAYLIWSSGLLFRQISQEYVP
jgi:outer membrane protein TolC